jgi:3-methyladenine DNA glycosylase/8-oxoguanine DNA glycosylase
VSKTEARAAGERLVNTEFRPRGPYSLAVTARLASDATRTFRDGVLRCVLPGDGGPRVARAWQRPDGRIVASVPDEATLARLRFVLAADDDHTEFIRRFAKDPLLAGPISNLRGMRVLRVPTVAQALLRALCGQLVDWKTAKSLERRVIAATSRPFAGLYVPPSAAELARLSPAELRALGLHARRGATLVRLCSSFDVERLRAVTPGAAAARLRRERGVGAWSVGVVSLQGLGSYAYGIEGDLGLLKLWKALHGRWPEEGEDAKLLAPYGEWAGLASVYLLSGFAHGLIPLPEGTQKRKGSQLVRRAA